MRALLNTLGATVWGLTAILLAAAVATLSYRLTLNHAADLAGDSRAPLTIQGGLPKASASHAAPQTARFPATPGGRRDTRSLAPARTAQGPSYEWADTTVEQPEQPVPSASTVDESLIGHFIRPPSLPPARAQAISRVIARAMTAAQKALQAHQWQEAVENLEAALTRSGLTPFDEKTSHYMLGFANVRLNNLKVAQAEFEKAMGEVARAALFDALWNEKGEPAFSHPAPDLAVAPTIEDIARFYEMQGLAPAAKFLQTSKSFAVERERRLGDGLVADYAVDHVPTVVVNGKYRLDVASAGSPNRLIELVNYLVGKEAIAAGPS
jgi:hypothetical protein